mmetsp:Transcript_114996/g.228893  ORF Transcript_114996/g.228893 Transcript_114996/m.228893 type:complete len:317 (+) Transcript_114996:250-1200(+)
MTAPTNGDMGGPGEKLCDFSWVLSSLKPGSVHITASSCSLSIVACESACTGAVPAPAAVFWVSLRLITLFSSCWTLSTTLGGVEVAAVLCTLPSVGTMASNPAHPAGSAFAHVDSVASNPMDSVSPILTPVAVPWASSRLTVLDSSCWTFSSTMLGVLKLAKVLCALLSVKSDVSNPAYPALSVPALGPCSRFPATMLGKIKLARALCALLSVNAGLLWLPPASVSGCVLVTASSSPFTGTRAPRWSRTMLRGGAWIRIPCSSITAQFPISSSHSRSTPRWPAPTPTTPPEEAAARTTGTPGWRAPALLVGVSPPY